MGDEETYPRVDLAYEFVLPSYEWAVKRLDAIDARIQALQGLIIAATLAVPAFARAVFKDEPIDFGSLWFIWALVAFGLSVGIGVVARASGKIRLLSLDKIRATFLHLSEWEFKKDVICNAGTHAVKNHKLVRCKGMAVIVMTVLFLVEAFCLVLWIAKG